MNVALPQLNIIIFAFVKRCFHESIHEWTLLVCGDMYEFSLINHTHINYISVQHCEGRDVYKLISSCASIYQSGERVREWSLETRPSHIICGETAGRNHARRCLKSHPHSVSKSPYLMSAFHLIIAVVYCLADVQAMFDNACQCCTILGRQAFDQVIFTARQFAFTKDPSNQSQS